MDQGLMGHGWAGQGTLAAGDAGLPLVVVVAIAVVVLVDAVVLFPAIFLLMRAKKAGLELGLGRIFAMQLTGRQPRTIVAAWEAAEGEELGLSLEALETHLLAGGDVVGVVRGLKAARRGGLDLDFEQVCALDLGGHDVAAELEARMSGDA